MNQKNNNLPENARMVFAGESHEVWQWEQKMFDGNKKIFETINRPNSASVIAIVGDKIILQEQEQPYRGSFLSLPGGRCEEGEMPVESAKRELSEETGYVSDNVFLWKETKAPSTMMWKTYYFIAKDCVKIKRENCDNGEKIKNKLISFNDFLMLSENELFRHKDLIPFLYHLRLYKDEQKEFKKLLFGK